MELFIERSKETKKMSFTGPVKMLLESLKINPEEVIVVRNNTLLTDDVELVNTDSVKLLSVVSGG